MRLLRQALHPEGRPGRRSVRLFAASLLLLDPLPAAANAQDNSCPVLNAITNADGRGFGDLRIALDRPLGLASSDNAGLSPAPDDCSLHHSLDWVSVDCTWRSDRFDTLSSVFDILLAQLETCLSIDLPPASGPQPYGNAQALRTTEGTYPMGRGKTELRLALIEAAGDAAHELAPYHYISLSSEHRRGD